MQPALALIEFDSIAAGIEAGDAMAKKAPVARIVAGTVQPGKYLVLVAGAVADVEEALAAGLAVGASAVLDHVYLPGVHPDVVDALAGGRQPRQVDALGVVETRTVAATIIAAGGPVAAESSGLYYCGNMVCVFLVSVLRQAFLFPGPACLYQADSEFMDFFYGKEFPRVFACAMFFPCARLGAKPGTRVLRWFQSLLRPLRVTGMVALVAYVVHLVLLGGLVMLLGKASAGPWLTLVLTVGVFLFCWGVAEWGQSRL